MNPLTLGVVTLLAASSVLAGTAFAQDSCPHNSGIARWGIKTSMIDSSTDASSVDLASILRTPNPILDANTKRQMKTMRLSTALTFRDGGSDETLHEGDKISITGRVIGVACDDDGDIHLSVAPAHSSKCLIVEVPNPGQIHDGALKSLVSEARQKVLGFLQDGEPSGDLTFEGQLFIDIDHLGRAEMGQVGTPAAGGNRGKGHCAVNVWEIHPVTLIE